MRARMATGNTSSPRGRSYRRMSGTQDPPAALLFQTGKIRHVVGQEVIIKYIPAYTIQAYYHYFHGEIPIRRSGSLSEYIGFSKLGQV